MVTTTESSDPLRMLIFTHLDRNHLIVISEVFSFSYVR